MTLDDATVRALERHETRAHAIPRREVKDQDDCLVLFDPRDPDPFWNRMVSVRWPVEQPAFDRRLADALAFFAILRRAPHVWPSPVHSSPPDLADRLRAHGFRDVGGGHVMVLPDPGRLPPVRPDELGTGVTLTAIGRSADAAGTDLDDIAGVLAGSFGAAPGRAAELAVDLRLTLDDARVTLVLARVDGAPAAVAKATAFDGFTYLSSIGTIDAFRWRGLGGFVTRQAIALGGGLDSRLAYLGVWSGNHTALRLYGRLGFASIGESPDMLLD
jgi:ribosomal protein S18 acetylase RimI-like enzyme